MADFECGDITSDGGALFVRQVAKHTNILSDVAGCFIDHRRTDLTRHSIEELVGQHILGIACGYQDLNDHDQLRDDPLRADSGFAREQLMGWCEAHGVDYVFGLAKNDRLRRAGPGECAPDKGASCQRLSLEGHLQAGGRQYQPGLGAIIAGNHEAAPTT